MSHYREYPPRRTESKFLIKYTQRLCSTINKIAINTKRFLKQSQNFLNSHCIKKLRQSSQKMFKICLLFAVLKSTILGIVSSTVPLKSSVYEWGTGEGIHCRISVGCLYISLNYSHLLTPPKACTQGEFICNIRVQLSHLPDASFLCF